MDHVAGGIEFDHRRRHRARAELGAARVLAVEHQHVIVGVDAQAAEAAVDPAVRERLVP